MCLLFARVAPHLHIWSGKVGSTQGRLTWRPNKELKSFAAATEDNHIKNKCSKVGKRKQKMVIVYEEEKCSTQTACGKDTG